MYVITMICWRAIKYLFLSVLWVSSHKLQYSRCKKCIYSNYHLGLSTRSFSFVNLLWESHECNKIVLTDIHKIWLWCLKVTFRSSTQKVNLLIIFFFFFFCKQYLGQGLCDPERKQLKMFMLALLEREKSLGSLRISLWPAESCAQKQYPLIYVVSYSLTAWMDFGISCVSSLFYFIYPSTK